MISEAQRWITVYVGPTWKALAMQSLLDEAGYSTQVPDASANMGEEFVVVQSVMVPESEAVAALATYARPAEPRSA